MWYFEFWIVYLFIICKDSSFINIFFHKYIIVLGNGTSLTCFLVSINPISQKYAFF